MLRSIPVLMITLTMFNSISIVAAPATNNSTQSTDSSAATNSTQWLLSYGGKRTNAVRWDPRFSKLLRSGLSKIHVTWWGNHTLAEAAFEHLSGGDNPVYIELNRYVTLSAIVFHDGEEKGLLWIDTGDSKPTMIFARLSEETNYRNLTEHPASISLYVKDPKLAANLPSIFSYSLTRWIYVEEGINKITNFTLTDDQGQATQLSVDLLKTQ